MSLYGSSSSEVKQLQNEPLSVLSAEASSSQRWHEYRLPSNEHIIMSLYGSSSSEIKQLNNEPLPVLSAEEWLFRRAKSYQEYMRLIPIPTNRGFVIPYTSWVGLGRSMKELYEQPLHYLTNLLLKRMDQERSVTKDECVPLDMIIHPAKAEALVWLIEEVHRLTSSPHHLLKLWEADSKYHAFIDAIFP